MDETFLGGGESFFCCGDGDGTRLADASPELLRGGGGLRLPELTLREGEEEEEKDLERETDLDRDKERERERETEEERESEPE